MATDRDIESQVEQSLDEVLSGVEECHRSPVAKCFEKLLQIERNGWSERLQAALKEVERERKQASDVYAEIEEMNDKFLPFCHLITQTREASIYASSDNDLKVYRINQLKRSIDALLKLISGYADDVDLGDDKTTTTELVSVTGLTDVETPRSTTAEVLVNEKIVQLQQLVVMLRQKIAESKKDSETQELKFKGEIKHLEETINMQTDLATKHKKKLEQQIEDMKTIITTQRIKIRQKGKIEGSTPSCDQQTQAAIRPPRRHVCTQVDENVITRANVGLAVEMDGKLRAASMKDKMNGVSKSEVWDINSCITPWLSNHGKLRKTRSCFASDFKLLKSVALANDVLSTQHCMVQQWLESSPGLIQRENVDSLRSQVVDFAKKLEKARHEMDICQKQMSLMQCSVDENRNAEEMVDKELKRLEKNGRSSPVNVHNNGDGEKKKDASRDLVLKLKAMHTKNDPVNSNSLTYKPPKLKAKCLRCHQLYSYKDEKSQCRFHPKNKRKIERYDAKDKMIKMSYLWECCLQPSEAPGCSVGEHI